MAGEEIFMAAASLALVVSVVGVAGLFAAIVVTLIDWVLHSQVWLALQDRRRAGGRREYLELVDIDPLAVRPSHDRGDDRRAA